MVQCLPGQSRGQYPAQNGAVPMISPSCFWAFLQYSVQLDALIRAMDSFASPLLHCQHLAEVFPVLNVTVIDATMHT